MKKRFAMRLCLVFIAAIAMSILFVSAVVSTAMMNDGVVNVSTGLSKDNLGISHNAIAASELTAVAPIDNIKPSVEDGFITTETGNFRTISDNSELKFTWRTAAAYTLSVHFGSASIGSGKDIYTVKQGERIVVTLLDNKSYSINGERIRSRTIEINVFGEYGGAASFGSATNVEELAIQTDKEVLLEAFSIADFEKANTECVYLSDNGATMAYSTVAHQCEIIMIDNNNDFVKSILNFFAPIEEEPELPAEPDPDTPTDPDLPSDPNEENPDLPTEDDGEITPPEIPEQPDVDEPEQPNDPNENENSGDTDLPTDPEVPVEPDTDTPTDPDLPNEDDGEITPPEIPELPENPDGDKPEQPELPNEDDNDGDTELPEKPDEPNIDLPTEPDLPAEPDTDTPTDPDLPSDPEPSEPEEEKPEQPEKPNIDDNNDSDLPTEPEPSDPVEPDPDLPNGDDGEITPPEIPEQPEKPNDPDLPNEDENNDNAELPNEDNNNGDTEQPTEPDLPAPPTDDNVDEEIPNTDIEFPPNQTPKDNLEITNNLDFVATKTGDYRTDAYYSELEFLWRGEATYTLYVFQGDATIICGDEVINVAAGKAWIIKFGKNEVIIDGKIYNVDKIQIIVNGVATFGQEPLESSVEIKTDVEFKLDGYNLPRYVAERPNFIVDESVGSITLFSNIERTIEIVLIDCSGNYVTFVLNFVAPPVVEPDDSEKPPIIPDKPGESETPPPVDPPTDDDKPEVPDDKPPVDEDQDPNPPIPPQDPDDGVDPDNDDDNGNEENPNAGEEDSEKPNDDNNGNGEKPDDGNDSEPPNDEENPNDQQPDEDKPQPPSDDDGEEPPSGDGDNTPPNLPDNPDLPGDTDFEPDIVDKVSNNSGVDYVKVVIVAVVASAILLGSAILIAIILRRKKKKNAK